MKHVEDIRTLINILIKSERFHLLTIVGAAGWAKSHTVMETLNDHGICYSHLGAFSTPLGFYDHLAQKPDAVTLIDDTAGLLKSELGLSLLNSATWSPKTTDPRVLSWNTTSDKALVTEFEFTGKIIILANRFPDNAHGMALLSRSLVYRVDVDEQFVRNMFASLSADGKGDEARLEVIEFLMNCGASHDLTKFSIRTFEL